jgi:D-alanine-D-alanine ligase
MAERAAARIAVLQGGPSAEAAVSRVSAAGIADALREGFSTVQCIELDGQVVDRLRAFAPDVVFPALHGPPGEDGTVQGLLEMLGLPYVGSGVHASACAMDKFVAKQLFRAAGLPLARDQLVRRGEDLAAAVRRIGDTLGGRVVVKPTRQGSALGVTLVDDPNSLAGALETALSFDARVLVEERVLGREITVGVLELKEPGLDPERRVLPVTEILTPEGNWYDFHHRYSAGASVHRIPAAIAETTAAAIGAVALRAHEWLDCRDLSRADLILADDDRFVLLEVNTLSGMTPTSLFPEGAAAAGFDFPALTARLVHNALARASGAS